MKPISVRFKCFGPYMEEQTVDFEKLSNNGIFLICGETGSGKTEFVKYLAAHTREDEKLITIEDTLELHLDRIFPHRDIVAMKTNNIASYSDVLVTCMRQNPKWILLSEVRSAEAVLAVRNSISSGHYILSTIHADKASSIPNRMYSLLETNQDIEQFLKSIYRYIQIGVYIRGYQDKVTKKFTREIAEVTEFYVTEDNEAKYNTIYKKSTTGKVERRQPSKYLIDYLISDDNLKIPDITSKKDELNKWLRGFTKTKKEFFLNLENNEYSLKEQRIDKGLYNLKLEQNVKISYLYSDTAINKAFTTGTTYEDSLFVLYILASKLVLENAINLDFSRRYVLPLASSLMLKEKKQKRLLEILNNTLAKKYLEISINLSTYYEYKDNIDKLIKDGYLFSIVIDDTFNGDITELYLFSSIFIYKNSEFFDMIIDSKERIPARIVIL